MVMAEITRIHENTLQKNPVGGIVLCLFCILLFKLSSVSPSSFVIRSKVSGEMQRALQNLCFV